VPICFPGSALLAPPGFVRLVVAPQTPENANPEPLETRIVRLARQGAIDPIQRFGSSSAKHLVV
jgi:hypothetical protein